MTLLFQNKEKLFFCRTNNYLTETNFKTFKIQTRLKTSSQFDLSQEKRKAI